MQKVELFFILFLFFTVIPSFFFFYIFDVNHVLIYFQKKVQMKY